MKTGPISYPIKWFNSFLHQNIRKLSGYPRISSDCYNDRLPNHAKEASFRRRAIYPTVELAIFVIFFYIVPYIDIFFYYFYRFSWHTRTLFQISACQNKQLIFPMEPSDFHFSRKLWWKEMLKITEIGTLRKSPWFSNHQRYWSQIFIAQIEDLNEDCVKISGSYLIYFLRNKSSKSVTVGWAEPVHCFKRFS